MNPDTKMHTLPSGEQITHRSLMAIFTALMLGMFLAALDQTLMAAIAPTAAGALGGLSHISFLTTAYLVCSTVATPLYGKLGDMYGRKRLFQAAIIIFLTGSALSGVSQTMLELISFRGVQGIGAGGLLVGAQAIIGDLVTPRERGRYVGLIGGVFGIASILGPLLGGVFTDTLSWRWAFYVNIPFGALALFVTATRLHLPKRSTPHQVDYLGAAILTEAIVTLVLATSWAGQQYAWGSPTIISLFAASLLGAVAFIFQERRAVEPLMPLSLFSSKVFSFASAIGFFVGFAMFGAIAYLPLYLQVTKGASATASGLFLIPLVLGLLITSITSGRIISRIGRYRPFPIAGTLLIVIGMYLLSKLTPTTSHFVSSLYFLIIGLGVGLVMQVVVLAVQNDADPANLGVATSSASFFRSIGSSIGTAIVGSVFISQLTAHLAADGHSAAGAIKGQADPQAIKRLPPALHHQVITAFSSSLDRAFALAAFISIGGFVLTLLLPQKPLRGHAGAEVQADTSAEAGAVGLADTAVLEL
jgi:EmrB/QacA subfamily drug resistance transporter